MGEGCQSETYFSWEQPEDGEYEFVVMCNANERPAKGDCGFEFVFYDEDGDSIASPLEPVAFTTGEIDAWHLRHMAWASTAGGERAEYEGLERLARPGWKR